jgi:hypothetical protein
VPIALGFTNWPSITPPAIRVVNIPRTRFPFEKEKLQNPRPPLEELMVFPSADAEKATTEAQPAFPVSPVMESLNVNDAVTPLPPTHIVGDGNAL